MQKGPKKFPLRDIDFSPFALNQPDSFRHFPKWRFDVKNDIVLQMIILLATL